LSSQVIISAEAWANLETSPGTKLWDTPSSMRSTTSPKRVQGECGLEVWIFVACGDRAISLVFYGGEDRWLLLSILLAGDSRLGAGDAVIFHNDFQCVLWGSPS
jgi:hypothetical protein